MFVDNKAKGQISKRVFQENNFSKKQIFLSMHTFVCVSGVRSVSFPVNVSVLCFVETPVLRFALLPYYRGVVLPNPLGSEPC